MQNSAQSAIFPPQNHYLYDSYFIFHSCVIINLLFSFSFILFLTIFSGRFPHLLTAYLADHFLVFSIILGREQKNEWIWVFNGSLRKENGK